MTRDFPPPSLSEDNDSIPPFTEEQLSSTYDALLEALESKETSRVREIARAMHAADIASFIAQISSSDRALFIGFTRDDFDPEILPALDDYLRHEILDYLGNDDSAEAIAALSREEAVDVMESLSSDVQEEILEAIPEIQRRDLEEDLAFPEESVGRIANRNVLMINAAGTVKDAIRFIRLQPELSREMHYVYLVDDLHRPVGFLSLAQLLRKNQNGLLAEGMRRHSTVLSATMDREEVALTFRKYGLSAAPVVDDSGKMIGILTLRDIISIVEEEAQEDLLHLVGISESDLYASVAQTTKHRFAWLFVNLLTAFLASWVIAQFEPALTKIVALAVLMPIVASMSGNAGTQTVTVVVRALAMRELTSANAFRIMLKETWVGLLNGVLFAGVLMVAAYLSYHDVAIGLLLGGACVISLTIATLSGVLIPLLLEKAGFDPAVTSTVFLTTITDVISFASFLGLATLFLL